MQSDSGNKQSVKETDSAHTFLLSGQVSGQQLWNVVLAARQAKLRKEGLPQGFSRSPPTNRNKLQC